MKHSGQIRDSKIQICDINGIYGAESLPSKHQVGGSTPSGIATSNLRNHSLKHQNNPVKSCELKSLIFTQNHLYLRPYSGQIRDKLGTENTTHRNASRGQLVQGRGSKCVG
jgi:hypothetical protein